ncbi:hypothetical protein [Ruminococcus sp. Marseille-P6503]|uniref:hypothetical protein n=1 Tax=Ruminococcus sp. Marseille-P6503 TaxID=2364796 RepID=UPI000F53BEA3|nr:hypothetical protein [Ruminococcus sp. Marseille-P6503]
MALALKKKKEESTNEKIVRMFQEGKSVEDICAETELRNDIVVGVIRRKLGEDSIPETVITAKPKPAEPENAAEEAEESSEEEGADNLSKLERYMLEKKKKQQEEFAAAAAGSSERTVSLVDDYVNQVGGNAAGHSSDMESILAAENMMDEIQPPHLDGDIQPAEMDLDAAEETGENNNGLENVSDESSDSPEAEAASDKASKALSKMKAFAMSQIEANNARIAELEDKAAQLDGGYAPQLEAAGAELTVCQENFEKAQAKLDEACAELEKAREAHREAIAKADEEYRRRLEEIDAEYKNATAEANRRFQEYEEENKNVLDALDSEKSAVQAELLEKQNAVTELKSKMEAENEAIVSQIKSLKEENDGYQDFLV